jgi:hypothetical protein
MNVITSQRRNRRVEYYIGIHRRVNLKVGVALQSDFYFGLGRESEGSVHLEARDNEVIYMKEGVKCNRRMSE